MGTALRKGENDLDTWCEQNGELGQRILEEWDIEENFRPDFQLAPCDLHAFSGRKICWKCRKCGHKYTMKIADRTARKRGCPKCAGKCNCSNIERKLLKDWCDENGAYGEMLLREWDYKENLEEYSITPENVTNGSSFNAHWICSNCGNKFQKRIGRRTSMRIGCNVCGINGTSYPETFLYVAMKQLFPETIHRGRYFENLEYDIYVPEINLFIEYGSQYYHKDKVERDIYKKQVCIANGGDFINILADTKFDMEIWEQDRIVIQIGYKNQEKDYERILTYILEMYGRSIEEINLDNAHRETLIRIKKPLLDGKDVKTLYPNLVKEWDMELNLVKPETVTPGSHMKIQWKCTKCQCVWKNSVHNRTSFKSGCPYCRYNIFMGRINYNISPRPKPFSYLDFTITDL